MLELLYAVALQNTHRLTGIRSEFYQKMFIEFSHIIFVFCSTLPQQCNQDVPCISNLYLHIFRYRLNIIKSLLKRRGIIPQLLMILKRSAPRELENKLANCSTQLKAGAILLKVDLLNVSSKQNRRLAS